MSVVVRVGIVSWNTADLLDRCLDALPAALDGLDAEVVVIDNASTDASAATASAHPGVRVERLERNVGYARGMNRALADTQAPVLIALNPDTEPGPGSLRTLVEYLLANDGVGLVAPRLVHTDGSLQHSVHRFPSIRLAAAANLLPASLLRKRLGSRLWIEGSADHETSGPIDWPIGAVHVMRRGAVGDKPYSERWFMYVEDLDLCWRLHREGWRVELLADVSVPHVGNAAGAQQWGSGRTGRWLVATYDWYERARGRQATRAYAALNLVGATVHGCAAAARGRLRHDEAARRWGHELLGVVPVHARAVAHAGQIHLSDPEPQ